MSDNNIPFEIQTEIIQRIPDAKSVIRCRSVSKAWKAVIDSRDFVKAHTLRHQAHNHHHLLIKTLDCEGSKDCEGDIPSSKHCDHCNYTPLEYCSIVDDDTFPHQKVSVFVPDLVDKFTDNLVTIITSHGLFCFYEYGMDSAVIWNPSIRKTVAIPVPGKRERYYTTTIGFGVCPHNLDPKLVKITYVYDLSRLQDVNASTQVEVFTLSSGGTWRSPLSSSNLPHISIDFGYSQAVVDGFIYWDAVDRIHVDDRTRNPNLIMSFDLTTEEFTKVNLPDPLALNSNARFSLYNLRESLAVLDCKVNSRYDPENYHVWIMSGHGCTRSFDKLYSINVPGASIYTTLGFRKSGAPIIEVDNDKQDYYRHERALAIYEPESKSITNIGVYGLRHNFYVHSYMETLLLHGH